MANEIPSILHHVSVGTDNLDRACAFYDSVMPHLGASRMMSFPFAVAYGKQFPEFWIGKPLESGKRDRRQRDARLLHRAVSRSGRRIPCGRTRSGRSGRGSSRSPARLRPGILRSLPARPRRTQGRGRNRSGRLLTHPCKRIRHADCVAWNWAPPTRTRFDVDQPGSRVDRGLRIAPGLHIVDLVYKVAIVHSKCTIATFIDR